jgi:hypothetical protein
MNHDIPRRKSSSGNVTWWTKQINIYVKMEGISQVHWNCYTHAHSNNFRAFQTYYYIMNCTVHEFSKKSARSNSLRVGLEVLTAVPVNSIVFWSVNCGNITVEIY